MTAAATTATDHLMMAAANESSIACPIVPWEDVAMIDPDVHAQRGFDLVVQQRNGVVICGSVADEDMCHGGVLRRSLRRGLFISSLAHLAQNASRTER
jgi:hypothetical protein